QDMPGQLPDLSMNQPSDNQSIETEESPLPIPPLLKDKNPDPNKAEFQITAQNSTKEFIAGKETKTMGYNGDYLGPVIRVRNGEE
ncbi:copper oxidase, partial [Burkholderia multivorans]